MAYDQYLQILTGMLPYLMLGPSPSSAPHEATLSHDYQDEVRKYQRSGRRYLHSGSMTEDLGIAHTTLGVMQRLAVIDQWVVHCSFVRHWELFRAGSYSTQLDPLACHEIASTPLRAMLRVRGRPPSRPHLRRSQGMCNIAQIRIRTCPRQELMARQTAPKEQSPAMRPR